MFGTLGILLDVMHSIAAKKPSSSSSRTESSSSEQAEPPPAEPLAEPAEPTVKPEEPSTTVTEKAEGPPPKPAELEVKPAEAPAKPAKPDDLRRIEGIGPKISSVLREAGIIRFSQLAASSVDQLREILAGAGIGPLVDPSSWPEQARLAEEGDWEAFQKLKDELGRGRHG